MLINTVILLLRNTLPIVIIIVLLSLTLKECYSKKFLKKWLITVLLGICSVFFLVFNVDNIAQLYQGLGLELLFSLALMGIYWLIVFYLQQALFQANKYRFNYYAMVIFFLVLTVNASNFFIYFSGFWSQIDLQFSLLVGMLLGLGICLSIGILLYFILLFVQLKYQHTWALLLLLLFASGQLNQALNLLLQMDFLPSFESLWDSNFILNENSELGYFFTALLGYEATPSLLHVSIYLSALSIPLGGYFYLIKNKMALVKQENTHENF